jgi:hypothetical protein
MISISVSFYNEIVAAANVGIARFDIIQNCLVLDKDCETYTD